MEDKIREYFLKWFSGESGRFQSGMFDVDEIAYSAFLAGYDYCKSITTYSTGAAPGRTYSEISFAAEHHDKTGDGL